MMFSTVVACLAVGPAALALANMWSYRVPAPAVRRTAVSVLIPARNEERNIGEACACVLASVDVDVEVVVLDDHSTDRTREILQAMDDPRVRLADGSMLPSGWSGKQYACAQLARLASHELMVFVDADVRLAPDAVSRMVGYMQRHHDVGLASGFPHEVVGSWSERLLLPLIHFLLLGYLPMFFMNRSVSPGFGAGCGQLMIVRKAEYVRAGGHSAIRASLHDGIKLPRAFRSVGIMTGLFDAGGFASCRMYNDAGALWEGLTKNATEGMATWVALPIWTVILGAGQVLPLAVFAVSPGFASGLAVAASFGLRLALAWRLRQPLLSALLHPAGVAALLVVQWFALIRSACGIPSTWRGRAYRVQ